MGSDEETIINKAVRVYASARDGQERSYVLQEEFLDYELCKPKFL